MAANRMRIVARAGGQAAVDAGGVPVDVWPQRSETRARRKVARTNRSVDVRALPGPSVMAAAIDAIVTHQLGSRAFRVLSAVAYYAGLRHPQRHPTVRVELDPGLAPRLESVGQKPLRVYDCRHAIATTWLTRRHAPRRNSATPRTQRPNPRLHLRRRLRRRRTHRQPTRRHHPQLTTWRPRHVDVLTHRVCPCFSLDTAMNQLLQAGRQSLIGVPAAHVDIFHGNG